MQDNGEVPPMDPSDFEALMAVAGPLYKESKMVETYTSECPIPGSFKDTGSLDIKKQLEQAQRLAQAAHLQQRTPIHVPPAPAPFVEQAEQAFIPMPPAGQVAPSSTTGGSFNPFNPFQVPTPEPTQNNQMEFNFEPSKLDETNKLLKEISTKMTKMLKLLENGSEGGTIVPKQIKHVNKKN